MENRDCECRIVGGVCGRGGEGKERDDVWWWDTLDGGEGSWRCLDGEERVWCERGWEGGIFVVDWREREVVLRAGGLRRERDEGIQWEQQDDLISAIKMRERLWEARVKGRRAQRALQPDDLREIQRLRRDMDDALHIEDPEHITQALESQEKNARFSVPDTFLTAEQRKVMVIEEEEHETLLDSWGRKDQPIPILRQDLQNRYRNKVWNNPGLSVKQRKSLVAKWEKEKYITSNKERNAAKRGMWKQQQ